MEKTITQGLQWRYAVQVFDKTKAISQEALHAILESGRLTPSCFDIEAWKFIVVENPKTRIALRAAGFDQPKITDAACLIVIAYRTDVKENISRERIERTAKTYKQDATQFEGLKQMIDMAIASKSATELDAWAKAQAYIPLGVMISTATMLGIDTGPMEGFNPDAVDEILGLKEKNLHATTMLTLGYRGDDPVALRPKVRRDFDDVVEFVK